MTYNLFLSAGHAQSTQLTGPKIALCFPCLLVCVPPLITCSIFSSYPTLAI